MYDLQATVYLGRHVVCSHDQGFPCYVSRTTPGDLLAAGAPTPTIGRYTLLAKLGEGGMAEIFLAELRGTKGFSKRVVLKVLKAEHLDDAEQQSMFADEARLGSKLEHAHIPRVLELGEEDGLPFMVQEYVEGPNLDVVQRRAHQAGEVDLATMCRIIADVAKALDHAHHVVYEGSPLGVVHRDVSMTNVLVSVTGKSKLIDFGVARFEDRETKTEANVLKGKMRYLAPETLRTAEVSHQSDLFALGVVLYTVTTGRAPWRNQSDLMKRMSGNFTRPRELVPDFPEDLEAIVVGAMAPKPRDRVKTGRDLAEQLLGWCAAHGEVPSDADVAARVTAWFPEGRKAWLPNGTELDPDTVGGRSVPSGAFTGNRTGPSKPPIARNAGVTGALAGLATVASIFAVGAVLVLVFAIYVRPEPAAEVVVEVVDPLVQQEAAFLEVLEQGEAALDAERLAAAAQHVRTLATLDSTNADLLQRRQALVDAVEVRVAVEALEPLFEADPAKALERATALQVLHPDDETVATAVERAKALLVEKNKPAPVARPTPRPAPKPTAPGAPSMLSVKGSPAGADVVVDGRVVGKVPMQLVIDPGNHDVSLRMDGYVQRRVHVEAKGEPVEVSIDLPALKQ